MEEKNLEEKINFKKQIAQYLNYWKLFVVCIAISFSMFFLYVRYKNPVFQTESKIKILDEDKSLKLPSNLMSLMSKKSEINLENEVEVLKSKKLFEPIIYDLNLTTKYYYKGRFRSTELWNTPLKITLIENKDSIFETEKFIVKITKEGYSITTNERNISIKGKHAKIKIKDHIVLIEPNPLFNKKNNKKEFQIEILSFSSALENLLNSVKVDPVGKESDVLSIMIQDVNIEKSKAIVDKIVEKFNEDGIYDRQLVSKRTVEFIDDRFKFLTSELDSIENVKKEYKKSNDLTFIEADATADLQEKRVSSGSVFGVETQIALSNLLKDALNNNSSHILLPANIGLDNIIINNLVNEYNSLVLQRDKLLKTAGSKNPNVALIESEILNLKNNINQSIATYTKQLNISLSQQKNNYQKTNDLVYKIPTNEKVLRGIERQQQIKENLYLLLLQKREESAIAYAVTSPSIKIIDYANSSIYPISPKKNILYFAAFLIGFFFPFSILYIYFLFDSKIKNKNEIEFTSSNVPIIAEIPYFEGFKIFNDKNDRSVHAETFRIFSSNVNFSLPIKEDNKLGDLILTTSSIMGEGKTYITANLALALASYNKKVLLIGADMRKPKLAEALKMEFSGKGLSSYLREKETNWKDLLIKNSEIDVLFSGYIPPNSSNLLSNGRFELLIEEAKKEYDYILVDSAPTIYVNDTFLISKLADLTIYVTRFDYTERELIKYSNDLNTKNKLTNMAYIVNGIKNTTNFNYKYNYNYGYGYGYGENMERKKSKKIYTRILKFFKNIFK
jgi:capsular exopolysaccharide synthesis family protein